MVLTDDRVVLDLRNGKERVRVVVNCDRVLAVFSPSLSGSKLKRSALGKGIVVDRQGWGDTFESNIVIDRGGAEG